MSEGHVFVVELIIGVRTTMFNFSDFYIITQYAFQNNYVNNIIDVL